VPGYTSGFGPEEFDRFRDILRLLGMAQGTFDANEATSAILNAEFAREGFGAVTNLGDVIAVMRDMEDLGYIRRIESDPPGGPWRFEYVE
jgi:hypothetical protein